VATKSSSKSRLASKTDASTPAPASRKVGLEIRSRSGPGILHQLTGVIAKHKGNIASVEIIEGRSKNTDHLYFEIEVPGDSSEMVAELRKLPVVRSANEVETMQKIYGKRIIIVGGGAQVGQVALGAILEADRHNIRGEHISIDTIPLVGEQPLAAAVRATARLPRVKAIVMAGSLMGGEIEKAVREVRAQGILVVSLNMAGSVPQAADLVVTDPVQAGVMTVMAVADTAKFTVGRLKQRVF
jgi:energy-converting hydrogenase B subunit Q